MDVFGEMNTLLLDENRDLIAPGLIYIVTRTQYDKQMAVECQFVNDI